MENKNIIFTAPGIAEVVSKEMPVLGPGQVLVRIITTTISAGTERANLVGNPNVRGVMAPDVSFPRQVGYSAGAIVEAVGEGVESVKVGDRVACGWTVHAQYCVLPENRVHLLPDDVSFAEAALVHIVTFPMAAIRKCRLEMGESAIVMGQGVLGMIAVELLRVAGAAPIIAVDPVAEKRELALKRGADYALDPFAPDFVETVKSLTGGGAKVAIEVTGSGSGLDMVLDCMARYGRIALLGCTRDPNFTIDYYRKVHCPGITLIGAHTNARPVYESSGGWWTEKDDSEAIIRLVELGRLDLASLVEETYSPAEAPEVYDRLAKNAAFPIVQFDWTRLE
ncbi:MAG: zinc-binding alcohol dehydrogenase [Clostridia bacterium]|nr:zinc-binding alcohol dehydrogenase [Clostridia bacterium]